MQTITMPKTDKTVTDGTVVEWVRGQGEGVSAGDVLVLIETETDRIEVTAPSDGTIAEIIAPAGKTVKVGQALAKINTGKGEKAPVEAESEAEEPKAQARVGGGPGNADAVTPVLMPKVGQTMEEGTIVKWVVEPGQTISAGDIIFEVETDKSVVEVEAVDGGRLSRIVVDADETVPVLTPVAYLAENDDDVDAYLAASGEATARAPAEPGGGTDEPPATTAEVPGTDRRAPIEEPDTTRRKASPAARKVASERGVDLSTVTSGSGPGGRILTSDVPESAAPVPATAGGEVRRPLNSMRKAIAGNLQVSKQTIPHFYMRLTIDAEPLMKFYRDHKATIHCSLNDLIIRACGKGMMEFPAFRSRIEGDEQIELPGANIGIAVGMEEGLLVPVVVGVEKMSLEELAKASRKAIASAKEGKVENYGKGMFTVTNLGMFGVEEFAAIINPPESAILAIGTVREDVIVRGGTMRPGRVMTMTLSSDHRVVDGLHAARFMERLKELLEQPALLE